MSVRGGRWRGGYPTQLGSQSVKLDKGKLRQAKPITLLKKSLFIQEPRGKSTKEVNSQGKSVGGGGGGGGDRPVRSHHSVARSPLY